MTEREASTGSTWRSIARESVLLALPFQVVYIALTLALDAAHVPHMKPFLAVLLVPTLWAAGALGLLLRFPVPRMVQLHFFAFITIGPYAGSALSGYGVFPGWDKVVHFDSGIMLAWLALWTLRESELRGGPALRRWMSLVFVLFVAMSFAAAWEICEFIADHTIGTHAQLNNADTMGDIIGGTLGGLVSLLVIWWFRRPRSLLPPSLLHRARR